MPVSVATVESIATLVPLIEIPVPAVCTVTFALPSKLTPLMARAVCNVVAVLAFPISAPVNAVELTLVRPDNVVLDAPSAIDVVPTVTELFVSAEFGIFVRVLVEPLIDLLVSVSVVALPTSVSVVAGSVTVPEATDAATIVVLPEEVPDTCTLGVISPFLTTNSFDIPFPYPRVN